MGIRRRPRLDALELGLVVLFGLAAYALFSSSRGDVVPHAEALGFKRAYGPDRHSFHGEEWLIRDFFQDRRGGVFVDVGASHYRTESNTYYLETALGWRGLAVDPLREFEADYLRHRPRTKFRAFFVSDVSNDLARLYVGRDSRQTSGYAEFTQRWGDTSETTAPTTTLDDLLDREGIRAFDFLNMDIELWEPKALAGFSVARFRPSLVCIEAHPEVRQQILDYFTRRGYVVVGKYLRADVWNLYFTPLTAG